MASPDEYMYEQGPFTIQLPPREKKITECSESIDSGLDEKVTNSNAPSGMLEQDLSDEEPHQGSKLDKVLSGIAWPKYNLPAFMPSKRNLVTIVSSVMRCLKRPESLGPKRMWLEPLMSTGCMMMGD